MLDTNILISALLFPNKSMNRLMEFIFANHQLVLSSYVVWELKNVVKRKFPDKLSVVERLLDKMEFENIRTPDTMDEELFFIRDAKDYPVLYTAVIGNVDILISGDRDFEDVKIERPEIMTASTFVTRYIHQL